MRLSPCVLVRPDGWARGEREGYGEPCDVTSLSLMARANMRFSGSSRPKKAAVKEEGSSNKAHLLSVEGEM